MHQIWTYDPRDTFSACCYPYPAQGDAILSPLFPVILGLPWLQAHNPQINWATEKIYFPSIYCQQHWLSEPSNAPATQLCMDSENETRKAVPKPYHDYVNVFSKRGADMLSPHRPYDCPIELLLGAEIPFGRVFPLSEREQETLKDYVQENLTKGFPWHSTSPAGAGIFFIEKKTIPYHSVWITRRLIKLR